MKEDTKKTAKPAVKVKDLKPKANPTGGRGAHAEGHHVGHKAEKAGRQAERSIGGAM